MEISLPVKIFLSHPNDDDSKRVINILEKMTPNVELFVFPTLNSAFEKDFIEQILLAIDDVDVFIALLNKNGRIRQWVNQEVGIAVAKKKDIIILAEKRTIDKPILKGFINEKNKTIVPIDKDDLEDKLIKWFENYREKNKMKILQRILIEDLKKLHRITDAHYPTLPEKNDVQKKVKRSMKHLNERIRGTIHRYKLNDYIKIEDLNQVEKYIGNIQPTLYQEEVKSSRKHRFTEYLEESHLLPKIGEYCKLRALE